MPNNTNSSQGRNNGDSNSSAPSTQKSGAARLGGSQTTGPDGRQLEGFIAYLKDNWKLILTELVAVGVTTYLNHDAKSKAARKGQEQKPQHQ